MSFGQCWVPDERQMPPQALHDVELQCSPCAPCESVANRDHFHRCYGPVVTRRTCTRELTGPGLTPEQRLKVFRGMCELAKETTNDDLRTRDSLCLVTCHCCMGWGLLYWHCVVCGEFHHASCLQLRVPEPARPRGLSTNLGLCHRCYEDQVYRFHEERELYEMWLEDKPQEEHAPTAGPQAPSQVPAPMDEQVAPLE